MVILRALRHLVSLAPLALLTTFTAGCSDDASAPPSPETADAGDVAPTGTIAELGVVDELAVYQGVKVSLLAGGVVPSKRNAPIIPSRPAFLRVHLKSSNSRARLPRVTAELRVRAPNREDLVLSDGPRTITPFFDDIDLKTSFGFELPEDAIVPGASVSFTFKDPTGKDSTTLQYPAAEPVDLGVASLASTLKVRFVPVRYDNDGSGRVPTLDDKSLEYYRAALWKMYPVSKIELSVREALPWPVAVRPDGEGWDTLLSAIIETRSDDAAPHDVYYVGVFNPASTQAEYCASGEGGCILGVAPTSFANDANFRAAMVLGYHDQRSPGTLAQELAHAMGRGHAPCAVQQALDPRYPYARAGIGVPGYDLLEKTIVDPNDRIYDFMGYCSPVWVSDYTFKGLYEEMLAVSTEGQPERTGTPTRSWRASADGQLTPGPMVRVPRGQEGGSFHAYDSLPGGIVVAPDRARAAAVAKSYLPHR